MRHVGQTAMKVAEYQVRSDAGVAVACEAKATHPHRGNCAGGGEGGTGTGATMCVLRNTGLIYVLVYSWCFSVSGVLGYTPITHKPLWGLGFEIIPFLAHRPEGLVSPPPPWTPPGRVKHD